MTFFANVIRDQALNGFVNGEITPKEYREAVQECEDTNFLNSMRKSNERTVDNRVRRPRLGIRV
jgi:hypothetical protein